MSLKSAPLLLSLLSLLLPDLVSLPARAETGRFTGRARSETTSDGIDLRSLELRYRNHARDLFWPYAEEAERSWDYGIATELLSGSNPDGSFRGMKALALLGAKLSKSFYAELTLGVHQLDWLDDQETRRVPLVALEGQLIPAQSIQVRARASRDLVYQDFIQPKGSRQALSADSGELDLAFYPVSGLKLGGRGAVRFLSDANRRSSSDLSVMAQLPVAPVWLWAGAGAELLSYSGREESYWSPGRVVSFGPRIEADAPLPWIQGLSASAGVSLSRFQEDDLSWGMGYYGSARLAYGSREALLIEGSYVRARSRQGTGGWGEDGLNLAVAHAF